MKKIISLILVAIVALVTITTLLAPSEGEVGGRINTAGSETRGK
jgi:hypothetical protein